MKQDNTKPKRVIENTEEMIHFLEAARTTPIIGIDTEFMRVSTYYPELCLVQVARDDGELACIDPLQVDSVQLGNRLAAQSGVVIIHSAGQDLEVLDHALGYVPSTLFDTQIAAALLGRGEQVSYAGLVRSMLGIELDKAETRTDWCQRPLTTAQVEYAFADVKYLIEIYETLSSNLKTEGKLYWMERACEELLSQQQATHEESVVTRFKAGASVPASQHQLLRELVLWRERLARSTNRPREWVVSSADLVSIARQRPDSTSALQHSTDLNPGQIRKFGEELTSIVQQCADDSPVQHVWQPRLELSGEQRTRLKALQSRVREFCGRMSITPSVVVSRADLESLVLERPGRLDGGWRRELLDEAIADLI